MWRIKAGISILLCVALSLCGAAGMAEETISGILGKSQPVLSGDPTEAAAGLARATLEKATVEVLIELRSLIDDELWKRGVSSSEAAYRDFPDAAVCGSRLARFDSIVAFGDSIFAGYNVESGQGIVQQLAQMMNLPLTCCAEPNATFTTSRAEPRNVVQQVIDYVPVPGATPLIILNGGTNDQYEYGLTNLGEYGSEDTATIYGATLFILENLMQKGIEPWQIVLTTPIPKYVQGDGSARAQIDAQLSEIGFAMYQVGLAMGCNVVNGYHTVFASADEDSLKALLMPDNTHPSEAGAAYYAGYIRRVLS